MCAFAFMATVTVVYKGFLENGRNVVVYKMMNDPIPEICCKNFPFYWFGHDKTNTWQSVVIVICYFVKQRKNIFFKMFFKFQGIYGISLVFACVEIRLKQIGKDFIFINGLE